MPIKSTVLGPGTLTIGDIGDEEQFGAQLTSCSLVPSVDTEDDINVLSGETLAGADTITWELQGKLLQDFEVGNLLEWCLTNKGELLPFIFVPNTVADRQWSGVVKVRPVAVGGDVKKRNTSDFAFPLTGDPIPAAAP